MIQFSRPKKTLQAAMDPFRRFETSASELLDKGKVPAPAPSRFDPSYYRTHDPLSYVPGDAQSVVSQAISSFPLSGQLGAAKGRTYTGYASSVVSQQPIDTAAALNSVSQLNEGVNPSGHRVAMTQFDRLASDGSELPRRRLSAGSMAPSDAPTASMYAFNYKTGDDDAQSVAPSQSGVTDY